MIIMTYRELKELVPHAIESNRVPSEKMLRESDANIVVQAVIGDAEQEAILKVYDNGFVSYALGRKRTVFALHNCADICYEWVSGNSSTYGDNIFDNEPWQIRLMMEGDERICKSRQNCDTGKVISYSAIAEDFKDMIDPDVDILEHILKVELHEELQSLIGRATKKQSEAIIAYYLYEKSFTEIADEMGISRQSAAELVERGIGRIKRYLKKQPDAH